MSSGVLTPEQQRQVMDSALQLMSGCFRKQLLAW